MPDGLINSLLSLVRTLRGFFSDTTLSLVFGAVMAIWYLFKYKDKLEDRETIVNAVSVFISSLAILPGFAVILLSFDKPTCQSINIEQKVFFAGGLVLMGLGYQGLRKNFK